MSQDHSALVNGMTETWPQSFELQMAEDDSLTDDECVSTSETVNFLKSIAPVTRKKNLSMVQGRNDWISLPDGSIQPMNAKKWQIVEKAESKSVGSTTETSMDDEDGNDEDHDGEESQYDDDDDDYADKDVEGGEEDDKVDEEADKDEDDEDDEDDDDDDDEDENVLEMDAFEKDEDEEFDDQDDNTGLDKGGESDQEQIDMNPGNLNQVPSHPGFLFASLAE